MKSTPSQDPASRRKLCTPDDFARASLLHVQEIGELEEEERGMFLEELGIIRYNRPRGGYFVCVDVLDGTAKRVVELCKEAGVNLTGAGATYPYGNDPHDSNIRIAPSFPSLEDLASAMDVFCLCARIAALEKLNAE